jgi:hypothetical protein
LLCDRAGDDRLAAKPVDRHASDIRAGDECGNGDDEPKRFDDLRMLPETKAFVEIPRDVARVLLGDSDVGHGVSRRRTDQSLD